jgi:Zn-dependent protease/CBS domain-containing protein
MDLERAEARRGRVGHLRVHSFIKYRGYARLVPGSFRIARLFGIDVRVHLSWLLIFVYLSYSLADEFGQVFPRSQTRALLAGGIAAILFFASVVAHEFAHSIVARRFHLPVSSITLFVLGGVASLSKEPTSARSEFFMAAAGPATSLAIAGGAFGLASAMAELLNRDPWLLPALATAQILAQVNLQVAIFNLLPGFPLDGGRVLRSILWGVTGSRSTATKIAGRGGQVIALLLVVAAALMFFTFSQPSALLLGLVAYFLFGIASQSIEQERVQTAIGGTRVAQVATTEFVAVPRGTSIGTAVRDFLLPRNLRAVAVVDGASFVGLVSVGDLRKIEQERWPTTAVDAVMTPANAIPAVGPNDPLASALDKFGPELPLLPVVEDGALRGLLYRESVVGYVRMREMLGFEPKR